jgi:hypothetical protein
MSGVHGGENRLLGLRETISAMDVRDSTFEVMRRLGMTTIFGHPGSAEVRCITVEGQPREYPI